ncbi:MAG: ATP-binding protein, partial [Geminicoccaceae bacterium]
SGTIEVRLLQRDRSLQLVVADDGVGIGDAPQVLGDAEARSGPPGGVGLRLIDMLAKQIGAKVRIDGPPGTRVCLSLAS